MHYNHEVYGGMGATRAGCPAGSVSMAEYGAVLKKKLAPYEKCFAQLTGNSRFSGLGGPRERGQLLIYAAEGANDAWKKLGHGNCVDAAQRAFLDEYVAVIGILCTYPESQALVADCKGTIAKLEKQVSVLEQRPASCPTCAPAPACPPPPPPSMAHCPMCPPPRTTEHCPACETCPACAAAGEPCPSCAAADDKPKYGLLLGVLAAGGITGFVLTRVLKKKKR